MVYQSYEALLRFWYALLGQFFCMRDCAVLFVLQEKFVVLISKITFTLSFLLFGKGSHSIVYLK